MKAGSMGRIVRWSISSVLNLFLLLGLAAGLVQGQAPASSGSPSNASKTTSVATATPETPDTVVLKVGDEKFTKADLDFLVDNMNPQARRGLATQGRKQLGEQFSALVVLSQQARSHQLDKSPVFAHKLALQKQQLQAQAAYDEIVQQAKVSPEEISQYYSAHAGEFEQVMVRQVVVRKRAANSGTGPGLPEEEAKARADAIHKALAAGTDIKKVMEDFKAPGDVIIEPEPRGVRRGGMRPEMETAVFALKDGEVSQIFDVGQAFAFFQATAHNRAELKDVTPQIEQTLQKQKVDAAVDVLKKKTTIWMDSQYFSAPLAPAAEAGRSEPTSKNSAKP